MTRRVRYPLGAVVMLIAASTLTGCGAAPPAAGTPSSASVPSAPVGDGAPHEAENQAYRQRIPVRADARRPLDAARDRARSLLAGLHGVPSEDRVQAALASAGASFPWVATDPASGAIAFEVEIDPYGCLVGQVPSKGQATVESAGFIADGGCHALTGH